VNRVFGLVVLGAVLLVAGCSGNSADKVGRQPSPSGSTSPVATTGPRSYTACMRAHGVPNFPDPDTYGGYVIGRQSGIDPDSPTYQAAYQACQGLV
jgi:hypothetical protein